jgi:hypothetical protein
LTSIHVSPGKHLVYSDPVTKIITDAALPLRGFEAAVWRKVRYDPVARKDRARIEGATKLSPKETLDFYEWMLTSGHAYIWSGPRGSGKTHGVTNFAYIAWKKFNFVILTNKVFKRKKADGGFELHYPENVYYIESFLQIMQLTAMVMKTKPGKRIFVDLDETQNFMSCYQWSEDVALDLSIFLSGTRKYGMIWNFTTTAWELLPAAIREWRRNAITAHLYKSDKATWKFNRRAKRDYIPQQITFMEKDGFEKSEPIFVEVTEWTKPKELMVPGDIIYDHEVNGNILELGAVVCKDCRGGRLGDDGKKCGGCDGWGFNDFSFREVIRRTQGCIAEDLVGRLVGYMDEIERLNGALPASLVGRISEPVETPEIEEKEPSAFDELKNKKRVAADEANTIIRDAALNSTRTVREIFKLQSFYKISTVKYKVALFRGGGVVEKSDFGTPSQKNNAQVTHARENEEDEEDDKSRSNQNHSTRRTRSRPRRCSTSPGGAVWNSGGHPGIT